MKGNLGDKQRLEHILDAIVEINSYTSSSDLPSFLANSMMRYATKTNLISEIKHNAHLYFLQVFFTMKMKMLYLNNIFEY